MQVDIKPDDHFLCENEDEEEHPQPFQMDAIDDEGSAASSPQAEDEQTAEPPEDSMAHKLDLMMDLLFDFIRHQCRESLKTGQSHQADHLFRAMMRMFNSVIVTTCVFHNQSCSFVRALTRLALTGTNPNLCNSSCFTSAVWILRLQTAFYKPRLMPRPRKRHRW